MFCIKQPFWSFIFLFVLTKLVGSCEDLEHVENLSTLIIRELQGETPSVLFWNLVFSKQSLEQTAIFGIFNVSFWFHPSLFTQPLELCHLITIATGGPRVRGGGGDTSEAANGNLWRKFLENNLFKIEHNIPFLFKMNGVLHSSFIQKEVKIIHLCWIFLIFKVAPQK